VLVFFDDILIYIQTWEEHLRDLEMVLRILEEQQFYAKLTKCEFRLTKILYLGHIIGANGVRVNEEKIRAIQDWPEPWNVIELRGFVGICTYYILHNDSSRTSRITNLVEGTIRYRTHSVEKSRASIVR